MKRVWIKRHELEHLKELFIREVGLNKKVAYIPVERVLPLLEKANPTRILWCRTTRNEFHRWGLKVGIRNNTNSYKVEVTDPLRWRGAIEGLSFDEPDLSFFIPNTVECPELIPQSDPCYCLPEWTSHLTASIAAGEKVLLTGPTGSGKSSLIRELAARRRQPYMSINLHDECSPADLIGSWKITKGKDMQFVYGCLPKAMKSSVWLVLEELDAARQETLFCLQSVLEDRGKLHIFDTGEIIEPESGFRIIATANTVGRGDESGLYGSVHVLNESCLDRFHSVFQVDYLPPADEALLLTSKVKGIELKLSEKFVKVANDLRQALKDGVIYSTISTRKLLAWANKTIQIGCAKKAAEYTITNKLNSDDRRVVQEVLQRHGF